MPLHALARHILGLAVLLAAYAPGASAQSGTSLTDLLFAPYDALYAASVPQAQAGLLHVQTPPSAAGIWDVSASNPNLVWRGEPGKSEVLVTTFTKSAYYSSYAAGQAFPAAVDL